jgi:hypothetical protein
MALPGGLAVAARLALGARVLVGCGRRACFVALLGGWASPWTCRHGAAGAALTPLAQRGQPCWTGFRRSAGTRCRRGHPGPGGRPAGGRAVPAALIVSVWVTASTARLAAGNASSTGSVHARPGHAAARPSRAGPRPQTCCKRLQPGAPWRGSVVGASLGGAGCWVCSSWPRRRARCWSHAGALPAARGGHRAGAARAPRDGGKYFAAGGGAAGGSRSSAGSGATGGGRGHAGGPAAAWTGVRAGADADWRTPPPWTGAAARSAGNGRWTARAWAWPTGTCSDRDSFASAAWRTLTGHTAAWSPAAWLASRAPRGPQPRCAAAIASLTSGCEGRRQLELRMPRARLALARGHAAGDRTRRRRHAGAPAGHAGRRAGATRGAGTPAHVGQPVPAPARGPAHHRRRVARARRQPGLHADPGRAARRTAGHRAVSAAADPGRPAGAPAARGHVGRPARHRQLARRTAGTPAQRRACTLQTTISTVRGPARRTCATTCW